MLLLNIIDFISAKSTSYWNNIFSSFITENGLFLSLNTQCSKKRRKNVLVWLGVVCLFVFPKCYFPITVLLFI